MAEKKNTGAAITATIVTVIAVALYALTIYLKG